MEGLKRFPFTLIFVAYVAYLGVQLYGFFYAADGQVEQHRLQIASSQAELESSKKKLTEGKFLKTVESKKQEIQTQIKKLSEYQGALSEGLDVPSMMKMLLTEAKKLELKVDRLEPARKSQKEYYLEQEFKLEVRGTYQQIAIFTQRVSQMERILRIESYTIKPAATATGKVSNQLAGQLFVRAYQYTLSKEDKINVQGGKL